MSIRSRLRAWIKPDVIHVHDSDRKGLGSVTYGGKTKYGNIAYQSAGYTDYEQLRENGRGVYNDSLIARSIVGRLVDNVINTGLTWESSPLWKMIPGAPPDDDERYEWTETAENLWTLYANSKEPDTRGRMTLHQIQRLLYSLRVREGEYFCILRYLNDSKRTSPVAIQVLNNDQITQPYTGGTVAAAEKRGASVKEGIEYNSAGKMTAIYVREDLEDWSKDPARVPVFGPKSGRRFVIHDGNFETAEQFRGFPELSAMVYELDRLTEYDITELENVVASALWMGIVETDKDAKIKPNLFKPAGGSPTDVLETELKEGISTVDVGKRALIMNNLGPGQSFKAYAPTHPNPNYDKFVEAFETRIAGSLGMPLSVVRQKFQASYSAARAEILFFWNNVYRRRDDFAAGFLDPFHEAWFSENVRTGDIKAHGFNLPKAHLAWLYGTWNGISRPVVDPVKEAVAVDKRQVLGHTTGEKEAKAYNGSDFRENVNRLKKENELLADAAVSEEATPVEGGGDDVSETDELKGRLDTYGVGVRAGAFTPIPDDEDYYRVEAGLPKMSKAARDAWKDGGDTRHPITLQTGDVAAAADPDNVETGDNDTETGDGEEDE